MAESYGTPDEFVNNTPIMGYEDDSGIVRFMTKAIASNNFDGWISGGPASVSVSDVIAGQLLGISSGSEYVFYPILSVSKQDPLLELGSYTGETTLYYVDSEETKSITYASSATQVVVIKEDFSDKTLGSAGWYISQEGNAIFTNVAVRGRIEATSGYIGDSESGWEIGANLLSNASVGFYAPSAFTGSDIAIFSGSPFTGRATAPFRVNYAGELSATGASISGALTATTLDVGGSSGIVYNGSAVTIGASVNILAPVTVNSLQVGASPTLLRISNDVNGTNDGIYIDANNYWYSDGQFGVGGSANNVVWSGSTLTVTGSINATNITASVGNVGGFNLSRNQLSTASVIVSSSGGFRLGNPTIFSVDQFGNMRATSASITGDITATSGRFTGSVVAQHITASTGTIAGWGLSASILSGTNASIVSTGDIILGTGQNVVELSSSDANFRLWAGSATPTNAPFRVTATGGLVATSASITGDITAQSGRFTGSVVAQHITASVGTIAGFTLANNQMSTSSVVVSSSGGFRLGNPAVFSVDQFGNLVANTASISGRINATSGSFSGDITASAGRFVGAVSVSSSGAIFAGSSVDSGQRTVLNASGLFGFHSNGLEAFALPVSGSPRLGSFAIIPTGIVSQSASNANMIYGNVDSSGSVTDGIVIRGFRSVGASAAIYNVQNGVATSYSTGNGFYVDENARFKLKGATGSLAFDGTDLYIDGNINARSGNFTGSVSAQNITASIGNIGGFLLSASSITDIGGTASNVGMTIGPTAFFAGASDQIGTGAQFRVTQTGSIFANAASITGDIAATTITSSVGNVGGFLLSASSITDSAVTASTVGMTTGPTAFFAGANDRIGTNAQFRVTQTGSVFANAASITGDITATRITASIGNIAGWTLGASALTGNSASLDARGSLTLGSNQNVVALSSTDTNRIWAGSANSATAPFRVSNTGFLTATGASITGNITAQSGTFTGSISAQHITASVGSIAGFTLANNQMSTASVIVSSSGGFRLGNPTVFSVNQFGNMVANSASLIGNINATSGSFTGNLGIFGSGKISVINTSASNQRIEMTNNSLTGFTQSNSKVFELTTGNGSASTIENGGFDTGVSSPWTFFWGDYTASITTDNFYSGGYAARLTVNANSINSIENAMTLQANQNYIISAWVYSASTLSLGTTGFVEMWVLSSSVNTGPTYFQSNTRATVILDPVSVPANIWTKVSGYFTPTLNDTYNAIALRANSTASTRIWWDSVEVSLSSSYSNIAGFNFNDGSIFSNYLNVSSDGNIKLGLLNATVPTSGSVSASAATTTSSDTLSLSGTHPLYRLWVGNSDPAKALMNIDKSGTININSGGDIVMTSSATGTADSVLSKISFRSLAAPTTNQGRIQYTPQDSQLTFGIEAGATLLNKLFLTAGTSGSVLIRGRVFGNDFNGTGLGGFVIDQANSRVGIGTNAPNRTLSVVGNASVTGTTTFGNTITTNEIVNDTGQITSLPTYNNAAALTNNVHITAAGVFRRNTSTQRMKYDIVPLSGSLSGSVLKEKILDTYPSVDYRKILEIAPVEFKSTQEDVPYDRKHLGFIAEDVADKMPEAATYDLEGIPDYFDVHAISAAMLAVVQEQQKTIEELKERVLQLEALVQERNT